MTVLPVGDSPVLSQSVKPAPEKSIMGLASGLPFFFTMTESPNTGAISFGSFATDGQIVRLIAKERVKDVKRRDKWKEGGCQMEPTPDPVLHSLTPPYRLWRKYGHCGQKGNRAKYRALTKGLSGLMMRDLKSGAGPEYVTALRRFIDSVRQAACTGEFAFGNPAVLAKFKDMDEKGIRMTFRPICTYTDLTTKILIALLTEYLSTVFDPLFHEEMLAFRRPRTYHDHPGIVTTNHDALDRIKEYRSAHDGQEIWVAECDIQKFFDIIDHEVVMKSFDRLVSIAEADHHGLDMSSARSLLKAFLDSYSFSDNVLALNTDEDFWRRILGDRWQKGIIYQFGWISEWLKKKPENASSLGIPQGASISTIITNMVLSSVDEPLLAEPDQDRLFVRYCDDIVIMHTSRSRCSELASSYKKSLEAHHLLYHPFKDVDCGTIREKYWEHCKSKNPFLWGDGQGCAARWIGFLGFEISRAGDVRMRKSSLTKKVKNITRDAHLVMTAPDMASHERRFDALKRTSVGIPSLGYRPSNILFSHKGITPNPYTNRQVKSLRRTLHECIMKCNNNEEEFNEGMIEKGAKVIYSETVFGNKITLEESYDYIEEGLVYRTGVNSTKSEWFEGEWYEDITAERTMINCMGSEEAMAMLENSGLGMKEIKKISDHFCFRIYCRVCSKRMLYIDNYTTPMLKDDCWNRVCAHYGFTEEDDNNNEDFDSLYICRDCMEKALGRKLTPQDLMEITENIID